MIAEELAQIVNRFFSVAGPVGIVLLLLLIIFKKQIRQSIKRPHS